MTGLSYAGAVCAALDRLRGVGYEHGGSLVNHAPMAAEALACMGYADEVPGWVEHNLRVRRYHEPPEPRWALSAAQTADWVAALGDFSRVADWSALFERELTEEPWTAVLARWWPRLLPGMSGALTHGVIRAAHAVRAVAAAGDALQLRELAHGLGYWAARYAGPRPESGGIAAAPGGDALTALDELVAESAGAYAATVPSFPVPLIHTITAPAAVRLVVPYLPEELHWPSYVAARRCSEGIRGYFGGMPGGAGEPASVPVLPDPAAEAELVAAAVELGDEHAIKLAEVAVRHNALRPDGRYAAASLVATRQIRRNPF
jgi:hypothetical protein